MACQLPESNPRTTTYTSTTTRLMLFLLLFSNLCGRFTSACFRGVSNYHVLDVPNAKMYYGCDQNDRLWMSCESWDLLNNLHFIRFWVGRTKHKYLAYTASSAGWQSVNADYALVKFGFGGRLSVLVVEVQNVTAEYFGDYSCEVMGLVGHGMDKVSIWSNHVQVKC